MHLRIIALSALLLAGTIPAHSQSGDLPEALRVLTRSTQRYAEARTYSIEATERSTYSGEYDGSWTKQVLVAAEDGRRFHFESRAASGSALAIADGHTLWLRHEKDRTYASTPEPEQDLNGIARILNQDEHLKQARSLKAWLAGLARSATQADFLPDEMLVVNNHDIQCRVIALQQSRGKDAAQGVAQEKLVWIGENDNKIYKVLERTRVPADATGTTRKLEITTTLNTVWEGELPDCLFSVELPDVSSAAIASQQPNWLNPRSLVGKKLPDLQLKSQDGSVIATSSFAGSPMLIDFWATWCGPCVATLPELGALYEETREKGLIFLALDQDDEPGTAPAFLRKRGYLWPDFNDPAGAIHTSVGNVGVPHLLLVDATGTIVYDGDNLKQLRAHIATLGPAFATLAPKSQACTATQ